MAHGFVDRGNHEIFERLYVVGIDPQQGAVTVGPREALERTELTASGVSWIAGVPPAAGTRAT